MKRLQRTLNKLNNIDREIDMALDRLGIPLAFMVDLKPSHGTYSAYNRHTRGELKTKNSLGLLEGLRWLLKSEIRDRLNALGGLRVDARDTWVLTTRTALKKLWDEGCDIDRGLDKLGFKKEEK